VEESEQRENVKFPFTPKHPSPQTPNLFLPNSNCSRNKQTYFYYYCFFFANRSARRNVGKTILSPLSIPSPSVLHPGTGKCFYSVLFQQKTLEAETIMHKTEESSTDAKIREIRGWGEDYRRPQRKSSSSISTNVLFVISLTRLTTTTFLLTLF